MVFRPRSIRAKLTLWYALLVLITLLAFGGVSYQFTGRTLSNNLDISLGKEVRWVQDFIQPQASKLRPGRRTIDDLLRQKPRPAPAAPDTASADDSHDEADEIWNQIFQHTLLSPRKTFIQVANQKGAIIYRSYSLGNDTLVVPDSIHAAEILLATTELNGQAVRVAATRDKRFTILVGYPLAELSDVLDNLYAIFLILIPIAVALSVVGGLYLANKSLHPVDDVTTRAQRITAENLDQTIPPRDVDDEIGRLITTMNGMIRRLHESFARVRQFSADASHELRTPLTIMRGEIELALRTTKTPEAYRRILASSLEEILRMTTIIDNLLTLAKADQRLYEVHFAEIDLSDLVNEVYNDSEVLATQKNISVMLKTNTPITLVGDRIRLRQLFLNLVDNAVKYTPEGGRITLSAERENGVAIFNVEDTGMGIPSGDIDRVFDRFYRVDQARSRELGGTGLGLSIAKWIAELHRGSISVKSEVNKGSVFSVHLPIN